MRRLLILFCFLPLMVNADPVEIDGIYYNLIDKAGIAEVTKNPQKYSGDIIIPESFVYDDIEYTITSIGKLAFSSCNDLISVRIPESVITIEDKAFALSRNLTSIEIPNSVSSINGFAFWGCTSLTTITLPDALTEISHETFLECSSLNTVILPKKVTSIGGGAFHDCTKLSSVTIGDSVDLIFNKAFANCSNLEEVVCYAENVPIIYDDAFEGSYIEYCTLYVPANSIEKYKADIVWGQFKEILPITDTGIKDVIRDQGEESFFTIDGKQYDKKKKGLNIIRSKDGKTKKVIIK